MSNLISESIHNQLRELCNPYRKKKIAEYLKTSSLDFIGVELPGIHDTVKKHIKGLDIDMLPDLMKELWRIRTFETRLAAIDCMKVYAKKGSVGQAFAIADRWIDDADTWAIVDPLCSPCLGSLILRDSQVGATLKTWRKSDNFWRRRASVLPYLYLTLKTQYKPEFSKVIIEAVNPHISDEEFFIGKAAGWVLRELSKREPEIVRKYIEEKQDRMTKLVIREASKKL